MQIDKYETLWGSVTINLPIGGVVMTLPHSNLLFVNLHFI